LAYNRNFLNTSGEHYETWSKKPNSTRNSYLLISCDKSQLLLFFFGKDLVAKIPDSFAFEKVWQV
jgi:hypothetical protein